MADTQKITVPGTTHGENINSESSSTTINENQETLNEKQGQSIEPHNNQRAHAHFGDSEKDDSENHRTDGKREITEDECQGELGFSFPTWRKWLVLLISPGHTLPPHLSLRDGLLTGYKGRSSVLSSSCRSR